MNKAQEIQNTIVYMKVALDDEMEKIESLRVTKISLFIGSLISFIFTLIFLSSITTVMLFSFACCFVYMIKEEERTVLFISDLTAEITQLESELEFVLNGGDENVA